jgi:hypothetical protein
MLRDRVAHDGAPHPQNPNGLTGYDHVVDLRGLAFEALVVERRAGLEREVAIVDRGHKVRGVDLRGVAPVQRPGRRLRLSRGRRAGTKHQSRDERHSNHRQHQCSVHPCLGVGSTTCHLDRPFDSTPLTVGASIVGSSPSGIELLTLRSPDETFVRAAQVVEQETAARAYLARRFPPC